MSTHANICSGCRRLDRGDYEGQPRCEAFPQGIPWPILDGEADHRKPYENDNGFRFEPTSDEAAEFAAFVFEDAAG